jgi:uncharacterized protein YukE
VSDLKKEATSLYKAASGLRAVGHHTAKPLQEFKAASHDLSALGALGSLLGAKDEILEFLGITDPAVDPDGAREIARKWRHLATGLDDAAEAARKALADVEWEGKAAKAFHKRSKAACKQATDMADALREGAKALDDFADKAHELLSEIGVILAEIAEFEIAGLALSVLTGGTSAVVSTLMAGQRAAKVVALVARIEQEGTALASAIRGVMEVVRAVERALTTLKEIRGVAAVATE